MPGGLSLEFDIATLADMERFGARFAAALAPRARTTAVLVTLRGPLGAGKTTLVRMILQGLGFEGAVLSPTYALHEPYALADIGVHHFDLYRLEDAEELEFIGARDVLDRAGLCLVEWPERGAGVLPDPDLEVEIEQADDHRRVRIAARSDQGADLVAALS